MRRGRILHILSPDKFTVPFVKFVNREFNPDDHLFLFITKPPEELMLSYGNICFLKNPYKLFLIGNTILFYRHLRDAGKIILHGSRLNFYFLLFPWSLSKTYWTIQGYEFTDRVAQPYTGLIGESLKKWVLKRVYGHITHIEGDSEYANEIFGSSAKFFYSHTYESNVIDLNTSPGSSLINDKRTAMILAGNSTSPTNHHAELFEMLVPFRDNDIKIICPLSYGIYSDYRKRIIKLGHDLFGTKFEPLTSFMALDDYFSLLNGIDIAVFNHKRQEAMGITVYLLNQGKIVYMNKETTSYKSFIRKGIRVFDNSLIASEGLLKARDVSENPAAVFSYYSYEKLVSSWKEIFNDKSTGN